MSILAKTDNHIVIVRGNIDSTNAAQFEEELFSFINEDNLTIDAKELTYISSAGLRVLLNAKKKLKGELILTNADSEVYNTLEMTGFSEFITVQKALRTISTEGLPLIGYGQTSKVYRMDRDTIVKVFHKNINATMVKKEINMAKAAFMHGIPTAISYDMVQVGDCSGVVYELLNAKDLADCIKDDPANLEYYIRRFADFIRETHKIEISSGGVFRSALATTLGALPYMKKLFSNDEEYNKFKAVLENVPDRNTFIHGDCHVGNVMLQGDELMFIDLSCAGTGHPIFDMMSMYLCTVCHLGRQFETFTDEEALKIWKIFLSSYLQTEDADFLLRAEEQIEAFSSARFLLGLLNIPDLIPPEAVAGYKAKVFAYYDKGLEPLCF